MDRLDMFVKIHCCCSFKITILTNKFNSIKYGLYMSAKVDCLTLLLYFIRKLKIFSYLYILTIPYQNSILSHCRSCTS